MLPTMRGSRRIVIVVAVVFVVLFLGISFLANHVRNNQTWSLQDVAQWHSNYQAGIQWVGYRGSDPERHYFVARVMDSWAFIAIDRAEHQVVDERPRLQTSTGDGIYHYLVDPAANLKKL